jgi:hypothetical protein
MLRPKKLCSAALILGWIFSCLPSILIEQINEEKLLEVTLSNNLQFAAHTNFILKVCYQRSCLLRRFTDQGLSRAQSSIISKPLLYRGLYMRRRVDLGSFHRSLLTVLTFSFASRMRKDRLCQNIYNFQELADARDVTLFYKTLQTQNCIHLLLPPS